MKRFHREPGYKSCYRCANDGTKHEYNLRKLPLDTDKCPDCGGRAFFCGKRLSRRLWPALPLNIGGKDTITTDGEVIPGAWEEEVKQIKDPRWRWGIQPERKG